MAVSDQHGGGVTLCRVLGRNLDDFSGLACIADSHVIAPRFSNRAHRWTSVFRTQWSRRLLGCRISEWCFRQRWAEVMYAHRCATSLHRLLPSTAEPVRVLVSPQATLSIRVLNELRRLRKVQYATWIMDDNWVTWNDRELTWSYTRSTESLLREHLQNAQIVITISEQMGEHYRRRFGVNFEVLFAPTPFETQPTIDHYVPTRKLAYFGTLSLWPADALGRLAPFLSENGYSLEIYSRHPLPAELALPGIKLMPPLAPDDVQSTMRKYDAVLLPIGYSPATASYTYFNVATKMAECLGSGTVTLAVGPAHAAMMQYLDKHDIGLRICDVDAVHVAEALERLAKQELRQQLIERDLAHVAAHLSPHVVQQRWCSIRDRLLSFAY